MTPTTNKTTFLSTTNKPTPPVVSKAPSYVKPKGIKLSSPLTSGVKLMVYGDSGTGKTYILKRVLECGAKIANVSSDFGGSGLETVKNALLDKPELLNNIYDMPAACYDDVEGFITKPTDYIEDIWQFDPDLLSWDGFTNFQTNLLAQKVGELTDHKKSESLSEAREEGFALETPDWGMIKKKTLELLQGFLSLRNPINGKIPAKLVTCLMDLKLKGTGNITEGSKVVSQRKPLLHGAAGVLSACAFSLVIQTKILPAEDNGSRKYVYLTSGHDSLFAKNRGYTLPPQVEDFADIWREVTKHQQQTS